MMHALVVDDDPGIRWVLGRVLEEEGFTVHMAGNLEEATTERAAQRPDITFLDVYLPDGNGMQALESGNFDMPVVILTAETTFDHAAQAYQVGAMEYLPKPFDLDEVRSLARRVLPSQAPAERAATQGQEIIIGRSPAMQKLFRTLGRVAASDLTVLITGESGTGKELVARAIHFSSERGNGRFLPINCGALPETLLESELFGYKRGAFTGAMQDKVGLLKSADKGTLFLDEIGELPAGGPVQFFWALPGREIRRGRGTAPVEGGFRGGPGANPRLENQLPRGPPPRGPH